MSEISPKFRALFFVFSYLSIYSGIVLTCFRERPADLLPALRQITLKTHIVAVAIWLFLFGMLFTVHVIPQLVQKIRAGRRTGIGLVVLLAFMTLSGYAIQLLPDASAVRTTALLHTVLSLAFAAIFFLHLYLVRPFVRTALVLTSAAMLLLALPLFFIKPAENLPDEVKLFPLTQSPAVQENLLKKK